jgi:hypothetical protein
MAVCFQNLPLDALNSRSAPSLLVGELFKKFGIFLNTGLYSPPRKYTHLWASLRSRDFQKPMATNTSLRSGGLPILVREFVQLSPGWLLFWVLQKEAQHRWKNHHV